MLGSDYKGQNCSIARSLELIGERWTILVLRDAFLGLRIPVTTDACEIIPERWANWLTHDPVVKLERQADALRGLKALYIDCGASDQFNLVYGARRFHRRLDELEIAHRYEEFPDNHSAVDYRMDESLPFLAKGLAG